MVNPFTSYRLDNSVPVHSGQAVYQLAAILDSGIATATSLFRIDMHYSNSLDCPGLSEWVWRKAGFTPAETRACKMDGGTIQVGTNEGCSTGGRLRLPAVGGDGD